MGNKRKSKREKIATTERAGRKKQPSSLKKEKDVARVSTIQIKKDLLRTLALSILAIGIVLMLYWGWL